MTKQERRYFPFRVACGPCGAITCKHCGGCDCQDKPCFCDQNPVPPAASHTANPACHCPLCVAARVAEEYRWKGPLAPGSCGECGGPALQGEPCGVCGSPEFSFHAPVPEGAPIQVRVIDATSPEAELHVQRLATARELAERAAEEAAAREAKGEPMSAEERAEAMLQKRARRAMEQAPHFQFYQGQDGIWRCYNPFSNKVYHVTPSQCSCPDWQYRCQAKAIPCKHILALEIHCALEHRRERREKRAA